MTKTTTVFLLMAGFSLAGGTAAHAQTAPGERAFIGINVGAQPERRDLASAQASSLYGETLTIASQQRVGNGPFYELNGGLKLGESFGIGLGLTEFSSKGSAAVTATIPNPLIFNQPATVVVSEADLKRSELGVHIRALYFVPVREKIDVVVSAGPSFIHIDQDMASGSVATGTQVLTLGATKESGTGFGFNAGVDGIYLLTDKVGISVVIHYSLASIDLPSATGVKGGGFQTGVGLHLRF